MNEIWVSPQGDNKAPGTKKQPVRTLPHALALMRRIRRAAGMTVGGRIVLKGGTHTLTRPLVLNEKDSRCDVVSPRNRPRSVLEPLTICSAPGERAVISGGRRITGWRATQVNGVDAWVASLPSVKRGAWTFTQLWVNGRRAHRPRLPDTGFYRIERRFAGAATKGLAEQNEIFKPETRFGYAEGDMFAFKNLTDVDFVALHFWIVSRIALSTVDEAERVATLKDPTRMQLTDNHEGPPAPYYLENVAEAQHRPGQWYLDRPAGKLFYVPRKGETMEESEVVAPVVDHLIRIEGCPDKTQYAEHIAYRDVTFSHCEYVHPADAPAATPQAACHVDGAIRMIHARHCVLENCTVEHVGSYGVEVAGDSSDCEIRQCEIRDTAAGGVKVFHRPRDPKAKGREVFRNKGPWFFPCRITVADCHIHDGGYRWGQAVGVLVGNASGIEVSHCHVHDFDYTGISVGWTWGYEEAHTYGNVIEWNHIHDIGRGALSDMGGIYTLGQQPGTRICYNHIHDVDSRGYGGWGIYPDEGSSDMLIAFNLVHDTKCDPFSQHYGRDNLVRNNIFAFGRQEGMVGLSKFEPHNGFTFECNIVVTDGLQITRKGYNSQGGQAMPCRFDRNLYFDVQGKRLTFNGQSWTAWRQAGYDKHSLNADPGFADLAKRDFTLSPDTPAAAIGFIPFDLSAVGPH